ncbi:restriction endonuclease subunit S [Methylomonas sp. MO1]|nr:restriction endonuclease subunit S [Methylomonas sp. MO1]MDT4289554.1 restriction endonuclease subunit S [Methylomonas sp. MO1]
MKARGFEDAISGSAQPQITQQGLAEVNFPIAPLAEQHQIAAKLDELLTQVDSIKTRLDAIPKILKRFRQSMLAAAVSGKLTEEWRSHNKYSLSFTDHQRLISESNFKPKAKDIGSAISESEIGWLELCLGHVFSVKSGDGLTAKEMISDGKIPVYGGNGINGYHDKANIVEPTIVIGRVGFYCGSVHLTEQLAWVTDNALIVSFPSELVDKKFAYLLLKATNLNVDSASTAQPVISGAKIYPLQISIPSMEEQLEISLRVEQLISYADQIEQRVKDAQYRVNRLTQSILAKAFRGELTTDWRLQNPDLISGENSAEALLKRIQLERNAQLAGGKATKVKKKSSEIMTPKQIIPVYEALQAAGKPLSGQELLASSGYPSDADTQQLEQFFLDIRQQLNLKTIVRNRLDSTGQDWFELSKSEE